MPIQEGWKLLLDAFILSLHSQTLEHPPRRRGEEQKDFAADLRR
jgi:hypothetical protein